MTAAGRKGAKREALGAASSIVQLREGEAIMRVVALRGSNQVEVEDDKGGRMLCRMPAKMNKSIWVKRGNYVLVQEADKQKVLEANGKLMGTLTQVLYTDHVRKLQATSFWPPGFNKLEAPAAPEPPSSSGVISDGDDRSDDDDDDDGAPPLERNLNRHVARADTYPSSSESEEEDD